MAALELDPLFLKAVNLLRSKNPESSKQLNNLVQEYREKTFGAPKKSSDDNGNKNGKVDTIKQTAAKLSPSPTNVTAKEKKPSPSPVTLMEKLTEMTNITDESSSDGVKEEEATIEEITVGSSLEPPNNKKQKLSSKISTFETSPISDSEGNDNIPIDEIIEMDFDGPICKICHLSKRAEEENLLVECSECHSHFHQNCHKPNVSTKDLNDPRLIWYCARCTKKMNKEMAAQQQQQKQQQHSSNNNGKPNPDAPAKVVSNPFQQQAKPFRRNIPPNDASKSTESVKKTVTPATVTSSDPVASTSKESSSREGSPSSKLKPRDVAVNSMKRLELVKKRANKMQQLLKQSSRK